jgi:hypothetical protein
MSDPVSYTVTYVAGIATSLAAMGIVASGRRMVKSHRIRHRTKQLHFFDAKRDAFYAICHWSPDRMLSEDRLIVRLSDERPKQRWLDEVKWAQNFESARSRVSGSCGYVTDCRGVDWRESEMTDRFEVTLSRCDYAEGIATWETMKSDPQASRVIAAALEHDPLDFIRTAPPHPLAASIGVLSHDGRRFLAVFRSATVATSRSLWTVGPYETLVIPSTHTPGDEPENFFALIRRGLKEELGLYERHYGATSISWFGYFAPDAHPWIFAQVRTNLPDDEVVTRRANCHSVDEAADATWLPFSLHVVRSIAGGRRERDVDGTAENTGDAIVVEEGAAQGRWILHAPHAISELWRMQDVL